MVFLRAAGRSLVLGAGSVWSASASAQAPAAPVSFPASPIHWKAESTPSRRATSGLKVPCGWAAGGHLLFSDVPGNAIHSWDGKRTTVFLAPPGYQGFRFPPRCARPARTAWRWAAAGC